LVESWLKYPDLEPVRRLRNEGRELLGKPIYLTEKRDGENVSVWIDEKDAVRISSHNLETAGEDIQNRMKLVPEWRVLEELIRDAKVYHEELILYGELLKTVSPTRLEPKRKHVHWVLFDVYNKATEQFLNYVRVYQIAYDWGIPVVCSVDKFVPVTEDEVKDHVKKALTWCGRHRREGVVGKVYGETPIFFKEKRDIPELPKTVNPNQVKPQYPPMPQETIDRAIQHAYDECLKNGWDWKDKGKAIPTLVKHLNVEAEEHNYNPPRNMYQIYLDAKVGESSFGLKKESK
jgi:aromatic ring-cleaving dioxygenase